MSSVSSIVHPRCTFCDKQLETCELFVEHREALHPKCELCNKVFKNKELFDAHYVSCKEIYDKKCVEITNREMLKMEKRKILKTEQEQKIKEQNDFFEQYKGIIDRDYKPSMTHIEVANLMFDIIKRLRGYDNDQQYEINEAELCGGYYNDDKFIDIDNIIERIQAYITEKFV